MKKVSNRLTQQQKRQLKKAVFIYLPPQIQVFIWQKFYHPLWQPLLLLDATTSGQ